MSTELAKTIIGLLIDSASQEAKKALPSYIQEQWLDALSDLLSKGLYHTWVSLLENIDTVKLEAEIVQIMDRRGESSD